MHLIKWRGKRLLAVAYLKRKTKIESLEKIGTDEWEKDLNGKIRVEKEETKKVNCGYWKTSMSRKVGAS